MGLKIIILHSSILNEEGRYPLIALSGVSDIKDNQVLLHLDPEEVKIIGLLIKLDITI